jgi:hypothetical protein
VAAATIETIRIGNAIPEEITVIAMKLAAGVDKRFAFDSTSVRA